MKRSADWGETTCVYVVQMGNLVKVGITGDPWDRIRTLQTACPEPLRLRSLTFLSTRSLAARSEKVIHKRLAERRMHGEWFRIDYEDAVETARVAIDQVVYGGKKRPVPLRFTELDDALVWAESATPSRQEERG